METTYILMLLQYYFIENVKFLQSYLNFIINMDNLSAKKKWLIESLCKQTIVQYHSVLIVMFNQCRVCKQYCGLRNMTFVRILKIRLNLKWLIVITRNTCLWVFVFVLDNREEISDFKIWKEEIMLNRPNFCHTMF